MGSQQTSQLTREERELGGTREANVGLCEGIGCLFGTIINYNLN